MGADRDLKGVAAMKTHALMLLGILTFSVAPALADVNVGDEAPEISAIEWFNLPRGVKSLRQSHLKGQIVMLDFWGTWCNPCIRNIPHLNEMHRKYKSKGVVLVGLSDEPESKVEPCIRRNKMAYIVGSGARATQRIYGVNSWPMMFLIAPDGKIAWRGHPSDVEDEIEELLKENPPRKKGFLAEKSASVAYRNAVKLFDKRDYTKSKKALEDVVRQFSGTKDAKKAKSKLRRMKKTSRIMEIIKKDKAERISKGWLECARVLRMYGDEKDALKYYKRIIRKYPGTPSAKLAGVERKSLEDLEEDEEDDEDEDEDEDE